MSKKRGEQNYFCLAHRLLACALVVLIAGCTSAQTLVTYDEYAQLSRDEQVSLFQEISAENRALLARTQAERWLALNREKLDAQQLEAVKAAIETIDPALYEEDKTAEWEATTERIMKKLLAVLPPEEVGQGFGAGAPYIPPID